MDLKVGGDRKSYDDLTRDVTDINVLKMTQETALTWHHR